MDLMVRFELLLAYLKRTFALLFASELCPG
jgi:hypothetical protein